MKGILSILALICFAGGASAQDSRTYSWSAGSSTPSTYENSNGTQGGTNPTGVFTTNISAVINPYIYIRPIDAAAGTTGQSGNGSGSATIFGATNSYSHPAFAATHSVDLADIYCNSQFRIEVTFTETGGSELTPTFYLDGNLQVTSTAPYVISNVLPIVTASATRRLTIHTDASPAPTTDIAGSITITVSIQ